MKPHIRMINGRWSCCGLGCERLAPSPSIAYNDWRLASFQQEVPWIFKRY